MKLMLRNSNGYYPVEQKISSIFDEFFFPSSFERNSSLKPAIELSEDEKDYFVKAELPGMKKEDIDIQVKEDSITISGEVSNHSEEKGKNIYRSEFSYGRFERTIPFSEKVDNKKAYAEYKDGILSVTLPKQEENNDKIVKLKI